tara:strand:+ start:278 stop:529 length:252 start_codon:yes stop_codon:yes gene_type:complete
VIRGFDLFTVSQILKLIRQFNFKLVKHYQVPIFLTLEDTFMDKYEDDFTANLIVVVVGFNVTLSIIGYFTVRIMDLYLGFQYL